MPDLWFDVDTALAEVPVNLLPLVDATDFKTIEDAVAYNAAGMALFWHFVTCAGAYTVTGVTPTTGGDYDWTDQGTAGVYTIEIPASAGASINNDTEGVGWFTGVATGVLPWRGPTCGFRASGLNDKLIESAYDAFRALAGTALPGVAAEGAGGLFTRGSGAGQLNQQANGQLDANVARWLNTAAATPTVAGVPEVDVTHWIGTAAATPTVAGVPEVDITHVAGATTSVSSIATSIATLLAAIGTLTDAAADGDPTTSDTLMQYVKQLINVLMGTAGIVTFPAAAAAGNAVSLAEVIRSIDTRLPAALTTDSLIKVDTLRVGGALQTAGDIIPAISGIGSAGGAAISQDAATSNAGGGITGVTSGTTLLGTQTGGTYANTSVLNGVYNVITGTATALDYVLQFLIGGGTSPVNVVITGYVNSANDTVTVQVWNHVGAAWETIDSWPGQAGTTNAVRNIVLYARHAGTSAAEQGKVYIRFVCAGMTNPALNLDQVYVSYAVTSRTIGYSLGAVWIDTVNGAAGTTAYVNGTADHPVNSIANAITLATALGLRRFQVISGSSITFAADMSEYEFLGNDWALALGGQDISNTHIEGATVSGIGTGSGPSFHVVQFASATLPPGTMCINSYLTTTITAGGAGDYFFLHCADGVAGANSATFGFVAGVNLHLQNYSGGMNFVSMAAGNTVEWGGRGLATIKSSCSGGSIILRGQMDLVDEASGAVTVTDTARWNEDQTLTAIETDTQDIQSRLPAALTSGGNIKAGIQGFLDSVFTEGAVGRVTAAFKQFFNIASPAATMDHGVLTDTVTTLTGHTPQTGDAFARIGLNGSGLTAIPWNATWDSEVESEALDALRTQLQDSIPADGTRPTYEQALYILTQFMLERAVVGTTCTVYKADGTTPLFTLTINNATTPTAITRAT